MQLSDDQHILWYYPWKLGWGLNFSSPVATAGSSRFADVMSVKPWWHHPLRIWIVLLEFRRRQWQPTSVLLPGKSHGWRSVVGYSPWALKDWTTLLSQRKWTSSDEIKIHVILAFTWALWLNSIHIRNITLKPQISYVKNSLQLVKNLAIHLGFSGVCLCVCPPVILLNTTVKLRVSLPL